MANGPLVIDIFTDFEKNIYWLQNGSILFSNTSPGLSYLVICYSPNVEKLIGQ